MTTLYIHDIIIKYNFWQLVCYRKTALDFPTLHEPLFFHAGEYDPGNQNEPNLNFVELRHNIKLSFSGNTPQETEFNKSNLIAKAIAYYKKENQ